MSEIRDRFNTRHLQTAFRALLNDRVQIQDSCRGNGEVLQGRPIRVSRGQKASCPPMWRPRSSLDISSENQQ